MKIVRQQFADRGELPVVVDLADHARGRRQPRLLDDAMGGIADALLGVAEALHQERGNPMAVVYARLALFARSDLAEAALLIGDIMAEQENLRSGGRGLPSGRAGTPLRFLAELRRARALHDMKHEDEAFALSGGWRPPSRSASMRWCSSAALRHDDRFANPSGRIAGRSSGPARARALDPVLRARHHLRAHHQRWPQAEKDFLYALELEPEQPFVLNYLGYSWVDMSRNLDRAKGMLHRAVELRPDDGFVDSLGWVYFRLGEYDAAVEQLERAVELEPGDPVINDHLGDAYWRVGRQREACYRWRRALTLGPEEDTVATSRRSCATVCPSPRLRSHAAPDARRRGGDAAARGARRPRSISICA